MVSAPQRVLQGESMSLGRRLPLWIFRGAALLAGIAMFFPPANPGRISEKINASASLFTNGVSYGTITNSMGRILRSQWIQDADITLLMIACVVVMLGVILCGVGGCMSLGNRKMRRRGFLFPLVGVFVWLLVEGRLRDFGKAWGWRTWLVLVVLCGIWWTGVYLEGGRAYLDNLLVHQTVDRAVHAFHHRRPWYWYLYTVWYAMGPWALLTIPASVWGGVRRLGMTPQVRFFLCISLTLFVLLSCFSSKLQIYLLPAFGFVNYAAFSVLQSADDGVRRWPRVVRIAAYAVAGAMLVFAWIAGWFFPAIF